MKFLAFWLHLKEPDIRSSAARTSARDAHTANRRAKSLNTQRRLPSSTANHRTRLANGRIVALRS
jgi:hypothetical protein